jgi:hypothetical protein
VTLKQRFLKFIETLHLPFAQVVAPVHLLWAWRSAVWVNLVIIPWQNGKPIEFDKARHVRCPAGIGATSDREIARCGACRGACSCVCARCAVHPYLCVHRVDCLLVEGSAFEAVRSWLHMISVNHVTSLGGCFIDGKPVVPTPKAISTSPRLISPQRV